MQSEKKMPKFYLVLIICWVVALSLLAFGLYVVREYLADYESVQPKYVAEEVFKKYFSLDLALVFIYYSVAFEVKTTVCGGEGKLNKNIIRHLPELFNKRKSFRI